MSLFNALFGGGGGFNQSPYAAPPVMAPNPNQQAPYPEADITVVGRRGPNDATPMDTYDNFILGNREAVEERDHAIGNSQEATEHKGMFGLKGTLRDVLGTIGDAMLVQGGADRVYAPHRQAEMEGDAMAGFTRDPAAAAERMTGVNPDRAQIMGASAADAERKRMETLAAQASGQREAYKEGGSMMSRILGATTPDNVEVMSRYAQSIKERYGLGDEFIIPQTGDEPWLEGFRMSDMNAGQQDTAEYRDSRIDQYDRGLDQGDKRIGISAQNAQTARIRAMRPPAARAARNPTEASELANIRRKVDRGESLRPGEAATWNRYLNGGSSSSPSNRRRSVSPPGGRTAGWTVQ